MNNITRKDEGKKPIDTPTSKCDDNIKIYLKFWDELKWLGKWTSGCVF